MHKKIDLTGEKIGDLLILEEISVSFEGTNRNRKTVLKLKCKCLCGNIFFPLKGNVLYGKTKRCPNCGRCHDLLNKKIGKLTVLSRDFSKKGAFFTCLCECGNAFSCSSRYLRKAQNVACPVCRYPKKFSIKHTLTIQEANNHTAKKKHLLNKEKKINHKFGMLKVISFSHWEEGKYRRRPFYKCRCSCKKECVVRGDQFKNTKSCGCLQKKSAPKGENKHNAKLKNSDILSIKSLLKTGMYSGRELAKMYNVNEGTISGIKRGRLYASLVL